MTEIPEERLRINKPNKQRVIRLCSYLVCVVLSYIGQDKLSNIVSTVGGFCTVTLFDEVIGRESCKFGPLHNKLQIFLTLPLNATADDITFLYMSRWTDHFQIFRGVFFFFQKIRVYFLLSRQKLANSLKSMYNNLSKCSQTPSMLPKFQLNNDAEEKVVIVKSIGTFDT